ncbi:MAG: inositol monophosphatase family protein [Acidimicrobiales bacterium]
MSVPIADDAGPPGALDVALELAQSAGRLLLIGFEGPRSSIRTKSSATDMVSDMDTASEAHIVAGLHRSRPDDSILGEEGAAKSGPSGYTWVVDPLDGTTNYLYGHPAWAVSIALQDDQGRSVVGVVHQPLTGETFSAVRGRGAYLTRSPSVSGPGGGDNPESIPIGVAPGPLGVAPGPGLAEALMATGFSYDPAVRMLQGQALTKIVHQVRDIRRIGSAALDLCWVGAGRLDGFWEAGLAPWDKAAGSLIAQEAGAKLVELPAPGLPGDPPLIITVAAAPGLEAELVALLAAAYDCPEDP